MLTRCLLHIGDSVNVLSNQDIKNWAEISCSYTRSEYDGVVRSFISQFEFVGEAYDLLFNLFLTDGCNSSAEIEVQTLNDTWEYETQFSCPLDFSTISWENGVLEISGVDNGLAAIIKANKSTKYEFVIGEALRSDATFNFDRLVMQESLTYEFTGGESYEDCADILVSFKDGMRPWVGNVGSELTINLVIDWNDDQTEEVDSYIFEAKSDIEVTMDTELSWRTDIGIHSANISVGVERNGEMVIDAITPVYGGDGGFLAMPEVRDFTYLGLFISAESLKAKHPLPVQGQWAVVIDTVWEPVSGQWVNTGKRKEDYFVKESVSKKRLDLKAGDRVFITCEIPNNYKTATIRFVKSKFLFTWMTRGQSVDIPVMTPESVANALLRRIGDGALRVSADISVFDERMANTYLFASESARDIPGAKLYTSFSEFTDWMQTVFGYVYYIGERKPSVFKAVKECGQYESSPWAYEAGSRFTGNPDIANIVYFPEHAKFLYSEGVILYEYWAGWEDYNDSLTGHPRKDTLFLIRELSASDYYYFNPYSEAPLQPQLYEYGIENMYKDTQVVHFVHRTELFGNSVSEQSPKHCVDLKYSLDTTRIYSAVTIGYDKKEYDNINGRDEFNFNNTYSTGCTVSDKTLSLLSKYRADTYGIEFAVQKRGEDTTDDSGDQDVFFVLCADSGERVIPDRSVTIENTLSQSVFNGAFSPLACLHANAGIIGLQSKILKLEFASSTANSSIIINGESMSGDVVLDTPIATCGIIEFSTDEVDSIPDASQLIEVNDNGVLYRGYLQDVDINYARPEAADYKLIVKEIEV